MSKKIGRRLILLSGRNRRTRVAWASATATDPLGNTSEFSACQLSVTLGGEGHYLVRAHYLGDVNFLPSESPPKPVQVRAP